MSVSVIIINFGHGCHTLYGISVNKSHKLRFVINASSNENQKFDRRNVATSLDTANNDLLFTQSCNGGRLVRKRKWKYLHDLHLILHQWGRCLLHFISSYPFYGLSKFPLMKIFSFFYWKRFEISNMRSFLVWLSSIFTLKWMIFSWRFAQQDQHL